MKLSDHEEYVDHCRRVKGADVAEGVQDYAMEVTDPGMFSFHSPFLQLSVPKGIRKCEKER